MERTLKNSKFLLSATLIAVLTACGGGGGGGSDVTSTAPETTPAVTPAVTPATTPVASTTLTGTAATGAALVGAEITVKDSKGASKTATADANGNFSVDVTGMTAPLIIRAVDLYAEQTYYAMAQTIPASNVINVTSITDSLAQASGQTPSVVFADPAANFASVDFAKTATAQNNLKTALSNYMQGLGIDSTVDFTTTAFSVDNTKVDALLDCLSRVGGGRLSVKASCAGSTAAVPAFDPAKNVATVPSTLAAPAAGTLEYVSANLPLINAQIKLLSNAWNGTSGDLATVLAANADPAAIHDGKSVTEFIADQVAKFAAGDRVTLSAGALVSFNMSANTVDMCELDSYTESGESGKSVSGSSFKKIDGVWKITTQSSAVRAACDGSLKQPKIRAITSNAGNGQGKLATVLPTKYAVCIGKAPRVNDGGTLTSEALCGEAGQPSWTFDVNSWVPASGTLSLVAYFVEISSKTVLGSSPGLTLDSTGILNYHSQDICAGHSQNTTCTPAAGVQ